MGVGTNINSFKRLKSRNVLRYLLGFHQEGVAELEIRLEEVRIEKNKLLEAAKQLKSILSEINVESEIEIDIIIFKYNIQLIEIKKSIEGIRNSLKENISHSADKLRVEARQLFEEIDSLESTISEVGISIDQNERYLNEMYSQTTKLKRINAARAVLNNVDFEKCPKCIQILSDRDVGICSVCGQVDITPENAMEEVDKTEKDFKARI